MAKFIIETFSDEHRVEIEVDDNDDFIDWMMACEFMMYKTARFSNAGFEKALELLTKGAMTYKISKPKPPE